MNWLSCLAVRPRIFGRRSRCNFSVSRGIHRPGSLLLNWLTLDGPLVIIGKQKTWKTPIFISSNFCNLEIRLNLNLFYHIYFYNIKRKKLSMKKIISVFNNKRGVGKTSLCWNLADTLARKDKKVLLIDFDLLFLALQIILVFIVLVV